MAVNDASEELRIRAPVGWLALAAAVIGLALGYAWSMPGGYFLLGLGLLFAGALLLGVWLLCLGVVLAKQRHRPDLRQRWARWAATPLIAALVATALHYNVPADARFAWSVGSLEEFARSLPPGGERHEQARRVGLYTVTSAFEQEGTVYLIVDGADDGIHQGGFAWSPGGPPRVAADVLEAPDYAHFQGSWYLWEETY
ncbi:hypothetical protein ABT294_42875 [Nonomuraea sp. NPDC000554]|uniref:hypothetical protein n=1 Tax=Nonomuraea sp. NPDC000554 TaxID=3154259 RepID=UPI003332487E